MDDNSDSERHIYVHAAPSNGLGVAGFVTSLVAVLTCGCLSPVGLMLSIIALAWQPRGMAAAGVVLGIVGSWWLYAFGFAIFLGVTGALQSPAPTVEDEIAAGVLVPFTEDGSPDGSNVNLENYEAVPARDGVLPESATADRMSKAVASFNLPVTPGQPQATRAGRYSVALTTGKRIEVLAYAEADGQYTLTTLSGGTVRFPKSLIKEIRKAD